MLVRAISIHNPHSLANRCGRRAFMGAQDYIDALIAEGDRLFTGTVTRHLVTRHFTVKANSAEDRIIVGSDRVYTASYRFSESRDANGGRLIWFALECQLPQVSTLVASIGIPAPGIHVPMLVMNLNLKIRFENYNVILGFRGDDAALNMVSASVPRLGAPLPTLSKPTPPGFLGVRSMFPLAIDPILWSAQAAATALDGWFAAIDAAPCSSHSFAPSPKLVAYRGDMLGLHAAEGAGFDGIFGKGWLHQLFADRVFPKEK